LNWDSSLAQSVTFTTTCSVICFKMYNYIIIIIIIIFNVTCTTTCCSVLPLVRGHMRTQSCVGVYSVGLIVVAARTNKRHDHQQHKTPLARAWTLRSMLHIAEA
jgi:hypothetical protein